MSEARAKSVFFFDEPTMGKLKGCALFWDKILVYEGYIQRLADFPGLVEFTYGLLEKDILKIIQTPEELQSSLHDKIYYRLDENLWKFLYESASRVTVSPKLPTDFDEIVESSSSLDNQNSELKQLYDSVVYERTLKQWIEGALESKYFPYAPPDIREQVFKEMMELAERQYRHFHSSRPEKDRYDFRQLNKMLVEQLTVSSALCIDSFWAPLYRYKLGNFSIKDAKSYLEGLDIVVPFATKSSIQDFSLDEILRLRNNSGWNKAMNRLADLCHKVRVEDALDSSKFEEKLIHEVVEEYQAALEEERMTKTRLAKKIGKGVTYTGFSLIPIVGSAVSTVSGKIIDPVLSYLWKREKQKNLPFFLNDIVKLKGAKEE